jgi:hypothetical protein
MYYGRWIQSDVDDHLEYLQSGRPLIIPVSNLAALRNNKISQTGGNVRPTVSIRPNQRVASHPGPVAFAGIKKRELSHKDKYILMDLLQIFVKVADSYNWTYFLGGGSLMGSVRHGGLIPWDDDIDVLVDEKHTNELKKAFKPFRPIYTVHDRGTDPILKLYSNKSYRCPGNRCAWMWPFLDICFYAQNDTLIWENHPYFAKKKYEKVDIFPLHKRPFENMMVNAPRNSLKFLDKIYGGASDSCGTWYYKHSTERGGYPTVWMSCKYLKDLYPFVFRRWVNGTMEETVKLGDRILSVKLVDELEWTVTKPYSTEPVNGMQ